MTSLVLIALAISNVAVASDARSSFVIYGSGNKRCKSIGTSVQSIDAQIIAWMAGYVSAQNELAKGVANIVGDKSLEPILNIMLTYCAAHPDAKIVDAAGVTIAQKMDEARQRLEIHLRSLPSSSQRTAR